MLNHPSVADEAQMRQEFRRLYREVGLLGSLQVLYEMLMAGEWLAEIIKEELSRPANSTGCACNATQACNFHIGKMGRGL